MDQIIITTLIKSEHIRMEEQLNRRPLVDESPQPGFTALFASIRAMFGKKETRAVNRREAVCCACCAAQQV